MSRSSRKDDSMRSIDLHSDYDNSESGNRSGVGDGGEIYDGELFIITLTCPCLSYLYVFPVDDGVLLGQWTNVAVKLSMSESAHGTIDFNDAKSAKSHSNTHEDENPFWPPTALHALMTITLWSLSLCVAIGFEDVSIVLALSGTYFCCVTTTFNMIHSIHF